MKDITAQDTDEGEGVPCGAPFHRDEGGIMRCDACGAEAITAIDAHTLRDVYLCSSDTCEQNAKASPNASAR